MPNEGKHLPQDLADYLTYHESVKDALENGSPLPGDAPGPDDLNWTNDKEKARYMVRTAADALKPQPPIEYIVDKLITAASLGVFYGEPGSKKTYSMLSLAVCVASGAPWLGFKTIPQTVLIIDEESGETRLSRRLGEALRGEDCTDNTAIYYVSLAGFKMDDKNDPTILQALIESLGAKLIIIDALADVMGGDENSKEDTQPVFTALRKMADKTGAAIILIHHSNKAGGYRGSSAIKGAVDTMVKVESEDGANVIYFSSEKVRDGDPQKWAAVATWRDETFTLREWKAEQSEHLSKSQKYVMRFLEDKGEPVTMEEIENNADTCSASGARQAVYALVDKGKVYRTNPGKAGGRGIIALYALKNEDTDDINF